MATPKDILLRAHWTHQDFKQRITRKQWKDILLNGDDTIIFNGSVWRLKVKNMGCGVMEIYKAIRLIDENASSASAGGAGK